MAVIIEAISVVVRAESILKKFFGGWEAFKNIVPNQTLCADGEIARVGFMTPQDVESFVGKLQINDLVFLRDGEAIDIAVADQIRGLTSICDWLDFEHVNMEGTGSRVAVCRLAGSKVIEVVTPLGWKYEGSLSSTFGFVPSVQVEKGMQFLRHEDGIDVYLNPLTGKEVFVGRTDK